MSDCSISCTENTRSSLDFNDFSSSGLNLFNKLFLNILFILHNFHDFLPINSPMGNIRIHCRRMISPHNNIFHLLNTHTCLNRDFSQTPIMIQPSHTSEILLWHSLAILLQDHAISIRWIGNHKHSAARFS